MWRWGAWVIAGLHRSVNQFHIQELNRRRFKNVLPLQVQNYLRRQIFALYGYLTGYQQGTRHLFLLSHMRAGSTLLTQILSQNPEILGYGELFIPYQTRWDLYGMAGKLSIKKVRTSNDEDRILMDKLLHNYLMVDTLHEIVARLPVSYVFLIRPPYESVSSLMRNFGFSESFCFSYYNDRLLKLGSYVNEMPANTSVALTYSQLTEHTPQSFALLEKHLGLRTGLSSQYDINGLKNRVGDRSAKMFSGQIVNRRQEDRVKVSLDPVKLVESQEIYAKIWHTMQNRCQVIREQNGSAGTRSRPSVQTRFP